MIYGLSYIYIYVMFIFHHICFILISIAGYATVMLNYTKLNYINRFSP